MAEDLQTYGVDIKFVKALEGLNKLTKAMKKVRRVQNQINNASSSTNNLSGLTSRYRQGQREMTASLRREVRERQKIEQNANRRLTRQQAVNNITRPTGAEDMRSHYENLERTSARTERLRSEREARNRQNSLTNARTRALNSPVMTRQAVTRAERIAQAAIRTQIAHATDAAQVRRIVALETRRLSVTRRQAFVMERMNNSSRQLLGNMVSVFAVIATGRYITRVGQDFEAVGNTMLAVSKDSKTAGENLKFVRAEAYRLGLGLKDASKSFAKMLAARGDMSLADTKKAFTGISEMGTLLGLSAEEGTRAINALQQMMSKGVVSAEELKLQMGEVLPNAIPLMAKAAKDAGLTVNGTVKELMALQQAGGAISSKMLPFFAERMHKAAINNKGLDNALLSNRVAMNRFSTSVQVASETIFKSGWSQGLTELFNTMAASIKKNDVLWKNIGKTFGAVFKGLAQVIDKVVEPALSVLGSVMDALTETFGDWGVAGAGAVLFLVRIIPLAYSAATAFAAMGVSLSAATWQFTGMALAALAVVAAVEELALLVKPDPTKDTFLQGSFDKIIPELYKHPTKRKDKGINRDMKYINPLARYQPAGAAFNGVVTENSSQRPVTTEVIVPVTLEIEKEVLARKMVRTEAFGGKSVSYGENY